LLKDMHNYQKFGQKLMNIKKWSEKLQKHQKKLLNILNGVLLIFIIQF